MSAAEDDWESAEVDLKTLKLDQDASSKQPSSPSVVIPTRLMNKPMANEINFFQDQQQQQQNQFQSSSGKGASTSGKSMLPLNIPYVEEPIDQILIDALQKPNERPNALHIEQTILTFVKSNKESLEFPPGTFNSYRRMLAYRIAHRFRLTHSTTHDSGYQNLDRGIVFFKGPELCFPRYLLIDLKLAPAYYPPYGPGAPMVGMMPVMPIMDPLQIQVMQQQQVEGGGLPPSSPSAAVSKKVQVMKRQNNNGNQNQSQTRDPLNSGNRRSQVSGVDKEKAYVAHRARIFGDEGKTGDGLVTSTSTGSLIEPTVSNESGGAESPHGENPDTKTRSGSQVTDLSSSLPTQGLMIDGSSAADGIAARSGSLDNTSDPVVQGGESNESPPSRGSDKERVASELSSPRTSGSGATSQSAGSSRGTKQSGHATQQGGATERHYVYDKKGQMTPNRVAGATGKNFYASSQGGSAKSLNSAASPERRYGSGAFSREGSFDAFVSNGQESPNPSTKPSSTYNRGKKLPPDVSNWKETKYTPRDKDAERTDPDFARRSVPMPQPMAFSGPQVVPMTMMAGGQYPPRYPDVPMYQMAPMPMPYAMQPGGMYPVQFVPGQGQWMPAGQYYQPSAPVMGVRPPTGAVYPGAVPGVQQVYDYNQQQIHLVYPQAQPQPQSQPQQQQPPSSQSQLTSSPSSRSLRDSRNSNGNSVNSKNKQYHNGSNSNGVTSKM